MSEQEAAAAEGEAPPAEEEPAAATPVEAPEGGAGPSTEAPTEGKDATNPDPEAKQKKAGACCTIL